MERKAWIEDGYVVRSSDARAEEMSAVRRAWNVMSDSRIAYLEGKYELANERLYQAFYTATEALVRRHGCVLNVEIDLRLAQRLGRDVFSERAVDPLFERARVLGEMLPLEPPLSEHDDTLVCSAIRAGIRYVGLANGFVGVKVPSRM